MSVTDRTHTQVAEELDGEHERLAAELAALSAAEPRLAVEDTAAGLAPYTNGKAREARDRADLVRSRLEEIRLEREAVAGFVAAEREQEAHEHGQAKIAEAGAAQARVEAAVDAAGLALEEYLDQVAAVFDRAEELDRVAAAGKLGEIPDMLRAEFERASSQPIQPFPARLADWLDLHLDAAVHRQHLDFTHTVALRERTPDVTRHRERRAELQATPVL